MSFLRHLLPAWKRGIEDKRKANAAILAAIDKELKDSEQEAIKSKLLLSLNTATDEWLDQYGKIFGVLRTDAERDDKYRQRIINYVMLRRGTIPAIRDAIRAFLDDYDSYIEIYEPHTNVFTLNKSKLNGPDHFLGEYYTVAVLDIRISRPFPSGLIDIINEFKPAGVTVRLTYRPSSHNPKAPVIDLPLEDSEFLPSNTRLHIVNGMNDRIRGHLNLTARSRDESTSGLFMLNDSKLNSLDRLAGSLSAANASYNLATFSENDIMFSEATTMADVLGQTQNMSPDFYTKTGTIDEQYAAQSMDTGATSYLYFTMDMATYFATKYDSYLREIEPSGVYTKETYMSLMDKLYVQYKLAAVTAQQASFSVQVFDLETNSWVDLHGNKATIRYINNIVSIVSNPEYLSKNGLMFVRFKFFPLPDAGDFQTQYESPVFGASTYDEILDGGTFTGSTYDEVIDGTNQKTGIMYDVRFDFFEVGFMKDIAIRPTINMFDGTVTSVSTITDASITYSTYRGIQSPTEAYEFVVDGGTLANHTYDETIDGSYKDYTS